MKNFLAALFTLGIVFITSGQSLNQYKYVIIPETYEFTGDVDQYRLNSLTKFLFEKEGFTTFMKTEAKPDDLQQNPCMGLNTRVENNSGLFVTKLVLILEDCYGSEVFRSEEGRSREKEYETAYQEALRAAFENLKELNYEYKKPSDQAENISVSVPLPEKREVDEEEMDDEEAEEEIEEIIEKEAEEIETEEDESEVKVKGITEYQYEGKSYSLKEMPQGYGLYPENASEPIAILIESEGGKNFIYNSLTNQGMAYFDADNNLVVEYFSRQENKKVLIKYKLVN